jgi:hypothetical protein
MLLLSQTPPALKGFWLEVACSYVDRGMIPVQIPLSVGFVRRLLTLNGLGAMRLPHASFSCFHFDCAPGGENFLQRPGG